MKLCQIGIHDWAPWRHNGQYVLSYNATTRHCRRCTKRQRRFPEGRRDG